MFGLVSDKRLRQLREEMTLYQRTLDDIGWINISLLPPEQSILLGEGFKKVLQRCRIYYYNNPLAAHWCQLTTDFVFGEGISTPKAKDPKVQEIIKEFWENPDNRSALTSYRSQQALSNKLQYEGNLFFPLFVDAEGNVRVRLLDSLEVPDIVCSKDDRLRPQFYKVSNQLREYNFMMDGYDIRSLGFIYYPDYQLARVEDFKIPLQKLAPDGACIYHVKINCDVNDKFGIPELYRGIDWMKAHKEMSGDLATLIKALSQLAWKKKVKGGQAAVNALKSVMEARIDLQNLPAPAGSTQIENQAIDTSPINTPTGGVKIARDGLMQMQLMVSAASGIMYHYYGDPSTGNLATAKSMELPMVKKFVNRQKFWKGVFNEILQFVIDKKIEVGLLEGSVEFDEIAQRNVYKADFDRTIDVDFPPILESDLKPYADALVLAVQNGLITEEKASMLFLMAANVDDVAKEVEMLKKLKLQPLPPRDITISPLGGGDRALRPDIAKPVNPPNIPQSQQAPGPSGANAGHQIQEQEGPKRTAAVRFAKKNNHLVGRLNGYARTLAANYNTFKKAVRENMVSATAIGKTVGHVKDLHTHLSALEANMKGSARRYFPEAVDIGQKFLQAHLKDVQIKASLYEANNLGNKLLDKHLASNDQYVAESLIPAVRDKLMETIRQPYDSEEEFTSALNAALDTFDARVEQYAGAFWTLEEAAVKEAGQGTGLQVNFGGADDDHTCEGCQEAMDGNPYPIDEAPEPGTFECGGNCRHALQISEEE
jgi:hypothetical protein